MAQVPAVRCGGVPVPPGGMPAGMGPPGRERSITAAHTAFVMHRDTRSSGQFRIERGLYLLYYWEIQQDRAGVAATGERTGQRGRRGLHHTSHSFSGRGFRARVLKSFQRGGQNISFVPPVRNGTKKMASPSLRRGEVENVAAIIEVHIVLLADLNKVEGVSVGIQSQG